MSVQVTFVVVLAALFAAVILYRQGRVWWRYRGQRVVTCPEIQKPAGVTVDARHAGATALLGAPELRLSSCSRWPDRAGCGQVCLSEVAVAPEDCLVRHILTNWYEGKTCVSCGRPFGDIEWTVAKPALLLPDRVSTEWNRIPADRLPETLQTAQPICFACHTASAMIREHPDMVVDRSRGPIA